jgi:ABC-type uncharacterized transport system auxiliary subunit
MIKMTQTLNIVLVLLSIGLLMGCGSAGPVPEDQYYRLQAVYSAKPLATKRLPGIIEVDRFVADGLTSERAVVYSDIETSNQVRAYHYDFWIKPPTVMLRDELVSFLRASKISDAVVTPEMRVNSEYALTGKIIHLEQVKMKSGYRTVLEIELGLRKPGTGKLLFLDTYRLENDANGSDVAAAVDSLNIGLSSIYLEFLTSISKL